MGDPGGFSISPEDISSLNEHKDLDALKKHGGVKGLAATLCTSLEGGIPADAKGDLSVEGRQRIFGVNRFKEVESKSLGALFYEQLSDPTLILLMVAAAASLALGLGIKEEREHRGYLDGIAILVAVVVVSTVGAVNDYQKDQQFRVLNKQKNIIDVTVFRGGEEMLIPNDELVVGDLLVLDAGDKMVADGVYVDGHGLTLDEASLTGESDPVKKSDSEPFCRSGTQVTEGSGKVLIVSVGEDSEWGRTLALVQGESEDTPLQEKLGVLATNIGKAGTAVAVVCFIALTVLWMIKYDGGKASKINEVLGYFLFGVTIVVVAVPEGLPLAVTISLAYSMKKMMKDNNFVRVLAACETMGGATCICSDKTGTLTQNRMTVTQGWFAGRSCDDVPSAESLGPVVTDVLAQSVAINSKAFLMDGAGGEVQFVGNRTECALLVLLRKLGADYKALRKDAAVDHLYGFSSERKSASVLIRTGTGFRLYCKGAAEIVLDRCTAQMAEGGESRSLSNAEKAAVADRITAMATSGLRTLAITYRDLSEVAVAGMDLDAAPPEDDLTLIAVVGIKDPLRPEVPDAVKACKGAGITVRMVTGDNVHTAEHIARECGIMTDGIAMEGPVFRKMSPEELAPLLPRLQVLARSSPKDKYHLVQMLKAAGEIVAVTGDGTNDAPALKESHVGLAMGIAGTEVAKEASDIVILDDNFSSIVKSVLWGRSVFCNIRKFLQFQLTINLVALTLAVIAAITGKGTPLNVLQLLWVNLIMDSMAALALATEDPTPDLLEEKPNGKDEPLISRTMWKHIVIQGIFQLAVLLLLLYGMPTLDDYEFPDKCKVPVTDLADGVLCRVDKEPARVDYYSLPNCAEGVEPCAAFDLDHAKWDAAEERYEDLLDDAETAVNSVIFNTFIMMQLFNEFNARKICDEINVFAGITHSRIFLYVYVITVVVQVLIMQFAGTVFHVDALSATEWGVGIAIGFISMPVSLLTKLLCGCLPSGKVAPA
mmetsp:Transcript_4289/g.13717  ORF Transcript_4289/g.13717 Transcript_4289/m.13717 type:complete len:995 (+) Transcript_4289:117-3101(+)